MTDREEDRIAAAFETELARAPMPPGLRAQAVGGAFRRGRDLDPVRPAWALALVGALVAVAIVTTLVFGSRALHFRGSTPATPPSAAPATSTAPSAPLALSAPAFHDGEVGVQYAQVSMNATGGAPPYQWTIASGALPNGMTIDSNGVISGTPTAAGAASFTVQVTDSKNNTAESQGSMSIASPLVAGYVQRCAGGTCVAETGCMGGSTPNCGSFGYVSGGSPPYAYSITGGTPPTGPTLNGLMFDGLFIRAGTFRFEVTVTDSLGGTAVLNPTFNVVPAISLSGGSCVGNYTTGCSVRLTISGGVGPPISAGASVYVCYYGCGGGGLPPGATVVVSGNSVIVTFPKGMVSGWKGTLYVQVADAYRNNAMSPAQVSVEVTPQPGH